MKCQINLDIYSPKGLDFCPAALLRRTSVFAAGENLGAGRIHSARACQIFPRAPIRPLAEWDLGAGYAGGITSAAVDGIRVAEAVAGG